MATLVLGAVGTVLGGPIGGAIGAMIGNQLDQIIFAPKGIEGPRLADLKMQASTYGQQIPKLFGTTRAAGNVIWATDLMETQSTSGGGKGRPDVTQYSYHASVAVALSSRPILAVRRIWADGNLLRGHRGRLYESGSLRIHHGNADQAVDPLIAAALGAGSASAFRGIAYVVLENLDLTGFGNRIPSLSFEVEADPEPLNSGEIGNILLGEEGRCTGHWPITGYAASGDRFRDAMEPLFQADRIGLVSSGAASAEASWRLAPANQTGAALAIERFARVGRDLRAQDVKERRRTSLAALPGAIRLRHYEPERDYQTGQQASFVAGGGAREQQIELPAVLPAASARSLAAWLAAAASDGREKIIWMGDFAALALPVGKLVKLVDQSQWRISGRRVRHQEVEIELSRHQRSIAADLNADPGEAVPAPEWSDLGGVVRIFDLPNLEVPAASSPRLAIAASGFAARWRGADIWFVGADEEAPIAVGRVRPVMAMGQLMEALPKGSQHLVDWRHFIDVRLDHDDMVLQSADPMQMLVGANRCMIGSELLQFHKADYLNHIEAEGGIWRLSGLMRGLSGQQSDHGAETPFLLLDDAAIMMMPDSLAQRAQAGLAKLQWAERGDYSLTNVPVGAAGQALRPLSPVHGRAMQQTDGGILLEWVRRSRVNLGWRDHVDMPLGEEVERWRITLKSGDEAWQPELFGPWLTQETRLHLPADIVAILSHGVSAHVAQIGDHALSESLEISLG